MNGTSVKRTERGWAGHHICSAYCKFLRNTLLECGKVRIIVSTVGASQRNDTEPCQTVGHDRYYETMAFHALQSTGDYWDINVCRQINLAGQCAIDHAGVPADQEANDMHEVAVTQVTVLLENGVTFGEETEDERMEAGKHDQEDEDSLSPEERLLELEHETLRLVTEAEALRRRVLAATLKLP